MVEELLARNRAGVPAPSRDAVDRFHRAAVDAGDTSLSSPRDRLEFGGLYSAYVADPDGTVVEIAPDPSRS